MGTEAATRAFAQAEKDGSLDAVLSIGWVGALQEQGFPGEFFIPNVIVNAQTGERFALAQRDKPVVLVTTARVAGEAEKQRLAAAYNGAIVDMESATVARLAQMRGIPVCCMKVITDEVSAVLPDLNPFIDDLGQMEMGRFIGYVLLRPTYWRALMQLGKASSAAAEHLALALSHLLECSTVQDIREINRTGLVPDW
jgi:adenosylhomocysteine nucleosidase